MLYVIFYVAIVFVSIPFIAKKVLLYQCKGKKIDDTDLIFASTLAIILSFIWPLFISFAISVYLLQNMKRDKEE